MRTAQEPHKSRLASLLIGVAIGVGLTGASILAWCPVFGIGFDYDGIPNTTLTGSASYIDYFKVPGTSDYKHTEWRVTGMGTSKETLSKASLYEQLRFESLSFRDSHGASQHLPRLRFRLGENLYLGEGSYRPYLGFYEEASVQFPEPSYSHVTFKSARFCAGYGCQWRATDILLGVKAAGEVSTNGSSVTLYYGPFAALSTISAAG